MKIFAPAASRSGPLLALCWVTLLCAGVAVHAAPAPAAPVAPVPAALPAVVSLDGPWRFQLGDDPRWADPGFNDSAWRTVTLSQPLTSQGIDTYTGYAWYRLRLEPVQLAQLGGAAGAPPVLLVESNSVGQVAAYVNGLETGHTRGMSDPPTMYQSMPFTAALGNGLGSGSVVIAIRTWAGPDVTIRRGLLAEVELGAGPRIAARQRMETGRQWNERAIAAMVVSFLFLCVAALGIALYIAQQRHSEYLWLALLCFTVAAGGSADVGYGLALLPLTVYGTFTLFSGHVFMAVTLEFVLRFTASPSRKAVRIVQVAVLVLPFVYFLRLDQIYSTLSMSAQVVFCALVCVLLFNAWRGGRMDAGVMLLPFFLAATADSADTVLSYMANRHWLPEQFASPRFHLGPIMFGTGTVAYSIFLGSLLAVILYRFIRVSQQEQRSEAEIAAARSVQSLLIPTQLPSNRNFMLESAYLPVSGVGGDFFQVLPLKDDSLLLVVGDVSGKGLQAAMNSSTLVGALRNEQSHDPATVLEHLNRVLLGAAALPGAVPEQDAAPCFATCLCARVYPDGRLTIANAGHLSPYRDGRELELMPSLPLGVIAEPQYEEHNFQLDTGDRLVFMSDGVVEATNAEGELFGFERTQQVSHEPPRYIAQTAKRFGQTDDITVVSLYVASPSAGCKTEEVLKPS